MGLSRQGTLRSSHRRKNSMTTSLNLYQGRRSPGPLHQDQRSPQGRRSPVFLTHEQIRSPLGFPTGQRSPTDRRSPTISTIQIQQSGLKSPLGFTQAFDQERKSPTTSTVQIQDRRSPTYLSDERKSPSSTVQIQGRRSPIGFSQGLIKSIVITPTKSPTVPIPPITVSNPSETIAIIQKALETNVDRSPSPSSQPSTSTVIPASAKESSPPQERKEKSSVMKEILAFVRKPSKKVSTRTSRFAAAFSRAEPGTSTPLMRQSTFSSAPTASSRAAKSAVTKQLSEISLEPKMSLKFKSLATTKMSLRLRRGDGSVTDKNKQKESKKSSGDEVSSDLESDSRMDKVGTITAATTTTVSASCSSSSGTIATTTNVFELETVRFEKVGESYIKHEQIREETIEETSPVKIVAESETIAQSDKKTHLIKTEISIEHHDDPVPESSSSSSDHRESCKRSSLTFEGLKRTLKNVLQRVEGSVEDEPSDQESGTGAAGMSTLRTTCNVQCPTFEIEPPSRRASFDPPRSPYLENLRSPADPNSDQNRLDSGGESFEIVDTDRNRESSFEDRYSSMDTSFDISRYHSTSYEDQTSSFEMVESSDQQREKKSTFDLRKSSIELVDVETFQRAGSEGRKSSLETHFDYMRPTSSGGTGGGAGTTGLIELSKNLLTMHKTKKQISEPGRAPRELHSSNMKSHFSAPHRPRSPLSQQTSSNYSSRDSYDSSFEPIGLPPPPPLPPPRTYFHHEPRSPFADPSKQHFPLPPSRSPNEPSRTFLCTDQRCASIFEPRPPRTSSPYLGGGFSSGSEFEPPSPRRAASASPKHTFTFRIVLKKVESSPDAICPSKERRSRDRFDRHKRRDSRRKKLMDTGKSF